MAIKFLAPRMAERGRIKIGKKGEVRQSAKGGEYQLPVKLDHIILTTMQRDEAGQLMVDHALMKNYAPDGGKITELPIRLLYDNPEVNFYTRLVAYDGRRVWCSGEGGGEGGAMRLNPGGRDYHAVFCPCEHLEQDFKGGIKCKPSGYLQVVLEGADRVGGVWSFRTTSWNSIRAIESSLRFLLLATSGILAGIPLHFVVGPKTVTVPDTGRIQTVWVASLEFKGSLEELRNYAEDLRRKSVTFTTKMALLESQALKYLEHHQQSTEEIQEIIEEFHPEEVLKTLDVTAVVVAPVTKPGTEPPAPIEGEATGGKVAEEAGPPEGPAPPEPPKEPPAPAKPKRTRKKKEEGEYVELVAPVSIQGAMKLLKAQKVKFKVEEGKVFYLKDQFQAVAEVFPSINPPEGMTPAPEGQEGETTGKPPEGPVEGPGPGAQNGDMTTGLVTECWHPKIKEEGGKTFCDECGEELDPFTCQPVKPGQAPAPVTPVTETPAPEGPANDLGKLGSHPQGVILGELPELVKGKKLKLPVVVKTGEGKAIALIEEISYPPDKPPEAVLIVQAFHQDEKKGACFHGTKLSVSEAIQHFGNMGISVEVVKKEWPKVGGQGNGQAAPPGKPQGLF